MWIRGRMGILRGGAMGKMGLMLEYEVVSTEKDAVVCGLGA